jgi:hypothetical protein
MGWLALVFVWFAMTVLRGQREQFACGALALAFTALAGLHFYNPDAQIIRSNLAHAQTGRYFDAEYAAGLSADAVPELLAGESALPYESRCLLAKRLRGRWTYGESWLSWNWSRSVARGLAAAQTPQFEALNCPKPVPVSMPRGDAIPSQDAPKPAATQEATPAQQPQEQPKKATVQKKNGKGKR